MNRIIFDTETISLNKSFIYNLGYVITDGDGKILLERDFVIRQIYDNKPLFATAYYAEKRPIYTRYMKSRRTKKVSWGEACRIMCKDIKDYGIEDGYAYNSNFDEKAFYFNHLFFRNKRRPLDGIFVHDIMDEIKVITQTEDYKQFCRDNGFMTKHSTPRAKQTAEALYAYLTFNGEYKEEHTALADSRIESFILTECLKRETETLQSPFFPQPDPSGFRLRETEKWPFVKYFFKQQL